MTNQLWTTFHLKPFAIKQWPDGIRAWIAIFAIGGCCVLIVCVLLISILLVRLGRDALVSPAPNYQEATRNFLFAFASAFGAPFIAWRTWVAHKMAIAPPLSRPLRSASGANLRSPSSTLVSEINR